MWHSNHHRTISWTKPIMIHIKVWGGRLCHFCLTRLYAIIFWWFSSTHNNDKKVSVQHDLTKHHCLLKNGFFFLF
jgi:hypothetical protein